MQQTTDHKINDFFTIYPLRKYSKGQVLLLAGENSNNIHYLLSGKVKMYDVNYRGDEIVLNIFQPLSYFPMSRAINPLTVDPYIYEAETDIIVHVAPKHEVLEFVQTNGDVSFDLLSRLYIGIDGMLGRMTYLMSASALTRLVYELVIDAKRFGKVQENGYFSLYVSEKDLGSRAGLSRETVSREMKKLKDAGLIIITAKVITITDLSRLQKQLSHAI